MKRFHVHIAVADLAASIDFYSQLFGQPPSKQQPDYAKWMLDDPRINFAISSQGLHHGVDHFGFQVDSPEELSDLKVLAENAAHGEIRDQGETTCCYARSEKHWTIDPQGLAWEHFMTLGDATQLGTSPAEHQAACCIPLHGAGENKAQSASACCVPTNAGQSSSSCC